MKKFTLFLTFACGLFAQHPQMILDSGTIAKMRAKVAASDADWLTLKSNCDTYLTSYTYWPSYLAAAGGSVLYSGNTGTADNGNLGINNGGAYQGSQYYAAARSLGVCYQSLITTNPTLARTYSSKAREVLGALINPPAVAVKGASIQYPLAFIANSGGAFSPIYWEPTGTGIVAGDTITISGATGCTNLNGSWTVSSVVGTLQLAGLPLANGTCTNHTWQFTRDNNFGARGYGLAMSMIYDWVYQELTAPEIAATQTQMAMYTKAIVRNGYGGPGTHPETNYASSWSNFFTQTSAAFLNDNPTLSNYCNTQANGTLFGAHGSRDYFNLWMYGGGFGEGVAAYGFGSIRALVESTMTALRLGVDWRAAPYNWNYVEDQAKYLMMATKPDRVSSDEQEYVYFNILPNPAVPTLQFPELLYPISWLLNKQGSSYSPYFQSHILNFEATGGYPTDSVNRFIYFDSTLPTTSATTLPKTYRSWGGNFVTARSDWTSTARVLHFQGGPSTGGAGNGKTQFESGAFSIWNGANPFVVFGGGERSRSYDILTSTQADQLHNERSYYANHKVSVFAADRPGSGFTRVNGIQGNGPNSPGLSALITAYPTKIDRSEDGTAYTYHRSVNLQAGNGASLYDGTWHIVNWTREIVFLRPKVFLVHDVTTTKFTDDDRAMFWTFGRDVAQVADPVAGQHRFDSTASAGTIFKGAMTTVLPASSAMSIVNHGLMSESGTPKIVTFGPPMNFLFRVEQRPAAMAQVGDNWLSVFDAATSSATVETMTTLTPTNGDGVQLATSGVVVFASGTLPLTYAYTGTPGHIVAGLAISTNYHVASSAGPIITISTATGTGDITSSPAGVLSFPSSLAPPGVPPTIVTNTLPSATINIAYSQTLVATGDPTIVWSVVAGSGSLPPWATLNTSTGVISGTPTSIAVTAFTVAATNATGVDTQPLTINVSAAIIPQPPTLSGIAYISGLGIIK